MTYLVLDEQFDTLNGGGGGLRDGGGNTTHCDKPSVTATSCGNSPFVPSRAIG